MQSLYGAIANYKSNYMEKSKGLGDTIEKFTQATGVKSFTQVLARSGIFGKSKDCGFNKKKQTLNKMFPYNPRGAWLGQRYK